MSKSSIGRRTRRAAFAVAGAALVTVAGGLPGADAAPRGRAKLRDIDHVVVVYEENHSFDNLYGLWPGVDNIARAPQSRVRQVDQSGRALPCLPQNDVNLASPPLAVRCSGTTTTGTAINSWFRNALFLIDRFIPATATTCPAPGAFTANGVLNGQGQPGGCTKDLVHRFYQEQYQLDGGRQDRYVTGSDALGLTQGVYDTRALPIYQYLHQPNHPRYAIADRFFQAAFGGSFLNHQWLVAAATPVYPAAPAGLHPVLDTNAMPTAYPLYAPTGPVKEGPLTAACPAPLGRLCGDYAVNTIQPTYEPTQPVAPNATPPARLPPQTAPTIGDRLSAAGVSWAWYSGGWSNADGRVGEPGWSNGTAALPATADSTAPCPDAATNKNAVWPHCPDKLFQFHHQALNYFASFAPGTAARAQHLRDEQEFMALAQSSNTTCNLPSVSFVKPIGAENEHPGYASETSGSSHLVSLLRSIEDHGCARNTMVVVTYDEFGGQWDHVPPPGQGRTTPGPHDVNGPGTRIPALILAPNLSGTQMVDHTSHDTTSILATIDHRFGVSPLSSRDARVADLSSVFVARRLATSAATGRNKVQGTSR